MEPSGGLRVIVQHADGLAARGHTVSLVTKDARTPGWMPVGVPVVEVPRFDAQTLPEADVHVATWFPTVAPTVRAGRAPRVFHFCQGYEGLLTYLAPRAAEIEEAYAQPVPKLVVSPHLLPLLARFPGARHVVPPALDASEFCRDLPSKERPSSPPAIGVVGPFVFPPKGVPDALRAVRLLRERGRPLRLLRASHLPYSGDEAAIAAPDAYLADATTTQMVAWYRSLDVLLYSSRSIEGLGLPPLEAMASGVPAVICDIPSLAFLGDDVVSRAREGDAEGLADAVGRLLDDLALWRERRRSGLALAATLTMDRAIDALEAAFAG
jgi:glycosyltransferase involved in cell wall biosynthesis